MNTTYWEVVPAFESIIKCRYELSDSLVKQWFRNALGQYELDVEELGFDYNTNEFVKPSPSSTAFESDGRLKNYVILTLAKMMKVYYLEQEVRRVNQLNNIIGKDISLNGTGDTKKYTKADLDSAKEDVAYLDIKQKPAAYN